MLKKRTDVFKSSRTEIPVAAGRIFSPACGKKWPRPTQKQLRHRCVARRRHFFPRILKRRVIFFTRFQITRCLHAKSLTGAWFIFITLTKELFNIKLKANFARGPKHEGKVSARMKLYPTCVPAATLSKMVPVALRASGNYNYYSG